MKNLNHSQLTLMFVLFLTGFFASCKKEDGDNLIVKDNPPVITVDKAGVGAASIEGTDYSTFYAYATDLGLSSNSTTQNFFLEFANGTNNGSYYSPNTTTVITFELYSSSATKISAGTYAFSSNQMNAPFTFSDAYAHFNMVYNSGNLTGGNRFENRAEGTLNISYSGDEANITYNVKFAGGEILQGSYTGILKYHTL